MVEALRASQPGTKVRACQEGQERLAGRTDRRGLERTRPQGEGELRGAEIREIQGGRGEVDATSRGR